MSVNNCAVLRCPLRVNGGWLWTQHRVLLTSVSSPWHSWGSNRIPTFSIHSSKNSAPCEDLSRSMCRRSCSREVSPCRMSISMPFRLYNSFSVRENTPLSQTKWKVPCSQRKQAWSSVSWAIRIIYWHMAISFSVSYLTSVRDNSNCHAPEGHRDAIMIVFRTQPVPAILGR